MPKSPIKKMSKEEPADFPQNMLNPKYTFDTFVIGSGNRFALFSCQIVDRIGDQVQVS